jgi:hypothetical protein
VIETVPVEVLKGLEQTPIPQENNNGNGPGPSAPPMGSPQPMSTNMQPTAIHN